MLIEIIIGIVSAIASVFIVAKIYPNKDHAFWRMGLLIAAIIYVIFALIGGAFNYLPMEIMGVLFYGLFVWFSKKYALWWLAVGWAIHIAWDVFLHSSGDTPFVPSWYPGLCLGFDIVIAAYIVKVFLSRKSMS